jgi:DNA-binding beta-propeller fold protein YncE
MEARGRTILSSAVVAVLWGGVQTGSRAETAPVLPRQLAVHALALPGAPPAGAVFMDYIAYDRTHHRVWVPAGNTGSVDVVDTQGEKITRIEGFATAEFERAGTKRTVGPSSAAVADGVVYVGNRADSSVCAVDASTLQKGACLKLESSPDGLAYVAATKELWVTTPRDSSITILDASKAGVLAAKAQIKLEGAPEGYAVDDGRGVFYTNLEDKDRTLAIDVRGRAVRKTWLPKCGEAGPRGLAIDTARNFLMVACTGSVGVLDAGHDGQILSSIDTGAGVDNIDYVASRHELYVGAGRAAKLTVAKLDAQGKLEVVATVATANGARNPVATDEGVTYLTHAAEGKLLVVTPAAGK